MGPVALWSQLGWLLACLLLLSGCSARGGEDSGVVRQPVVYGTDDRQQYYQVAAPELRDLIDRSSVALVPRGAVSIADNQVVLQGPNWQAEAQLCADVPFGADPVVADCSGILVAPDLVLTAGHCLDATDCASMAVVRGFRRASPDAIAPIAVEDLAFCVSVVSWDPGEEDPNDRVDFAWIQLDHPLPVDAGAVAPVFMPRGGITSGQPIVSFGYGGGGPVKADTGVVSDARAGHDDFFLTNLDAFDGMSGAPIFDAQENLLGIDDRGAPDFVWDTAEACFRPSVLDDGAGAEAATYAIRALDRLCDVDPQRAACNAGGPQLWAALGGCAVAGDIGARRGLGCAIVTVLFVLGAVLRRGREERPPPRAGSLAGDRDLSKAYACRSSTTATSTDRFRAWGSSETVAGTPSASSTSASSTSTRAPRSA